RKSTSRFMSMWTSARVASVSRRGPASRPASCSSLAKAPSRGSRSGRSEASCSGTLCLLDQGRHLLAQPLQVFLVLERGAELRLDGPDLGNRDLEVRQQLEQERLELLVRPVDLVDQQDGRRLILVVDRVQQRPPQQELLTEDLALREPAILALVEQPDVQELA